MKSSPLRGTEQTGSAQAERWFMSALEQVSQSDFFAGAPVADDRGALFFDEMAAELADSRRMEDEGMPM